MWSEGRLYIFLKTSIHKKIAMIIRKFFTLIVFISFFAVRSSAQFTQGNLVVTRVGDGTSALSTGNTAPVSLLEFNTSNTTATLALTTQTPVTTVNLTGGSGNLLTLSGNTAGEGMLSRSQDGRYLSLIGYNVPAAANATNYCIAAVSATDNGIMKITLTNGGSGYTSAPTVVFSGGSGTGAAATAVISGGAVSYIYVRQSGSGYTGTPTISFTGGAGTGATATVDADRTSKGTGYTATGLTVTFSAPDIAGAAATGGAQQTGGLITNIYITTNGAGYTTQPTVTINHPTGTGAKQCAYINPVFPYWQGTNVSKVIGRVNYAGAVDYSTSILNLTASNGAPAPARMVASIDGSAFWVSNNVVTYVTFGATAGTQINAVNVAGIHTYGSQLYTTILFGNIGNYNPMPVTAATPTNVVVQTGPTYGFQSMVLFDLDPVANWNGTGYDVMYLADRTYGLSKYYYNGTAWIPLNHSNIAIVGPPATSPCIFPSGSLASIIGTINGSGQPVIYGIVGSTATGNSSGLVSITDAAAYNTAMVAGTSTIAYLAKADANYAFRGVAFAPAQFPIPVTLTSFSGSLINNKSYLKWTTTSEVNAREFVVERSINGTDFTPLGKVAAANSNHTNSYSFLDANINNGINYYRLKMVDIDGRFKISQVVLIRSGGKAGAALTVFPNPVVNNLVISHARSAEGSVIRIVTAEGKEVARYAVSTDAVQSSLDVSGLNPGLYFIHYINKNQKSSISFIK